MKAPPRAGLPRWKCDDRHVETQSVPALRTRTSRNPVHTEILMNLGGER